MANIVIVRKESVVSRWPVEIRDDGASVKMTPDPAGKIFRSVPGKPALRMAMEAVMIAYKGYNPQTDRVTLESALEAEGPEGF